MLTFYEILGAPESASFKQIKSAYRVKAMELHPDRNNGSPEAHNKFSQLNNAYDVLSNPIKREEYNQALHLHRVSDEVLHNIHQEDTYDVNPKRPKTSNKKTQKPIEPISTDEFYKSTKRNPRSGSPRKRINNWYVFLILFILIKIGVAVNENSISLKEFLFSNNSKQILNQANNSENDKQLYEIEVKMNEALQENNLDSLQAWLKSCFNLPRKSATCYLYLGQYHERQQSFDFAIDAYKAFLNRAPNSEHSAWAKERITNLQGFSANSDPPEWVKVGRLEVMKKEITNGQFRSCIQAGACEAPSSDYQCEFNTPRKYSHSANCINWSAATRYCRWIGAKLPTQSEWRFIASSGGRNERFPWGNQSPNCSRAVYEGSPRVGDCGYRDPQVGCSLATGHSRQGICDLSGNVSEWVQDGYLCGGHYGVGPTGLGQYCFAGPKWLNIGGRCIR